MLTKIIIGLIVLLLIIIISLYNSLIRLKNRVAESWSDIEVQLKRRFDLIPNLLETVKAYAKHESTTLEKVISARNKIAQAQSEKNFDKLQEAETALQTSLKSIFALAESYPDLKANQNFLELQRELSDTEDKILSSRRFYNTNVRDFNTKLEVFPSNLIAKQLDFKKANFLEIAEAEKEPVKLKFD